jgi:hypothetical protein
MFELHVVVAGIVMFNILELIMEIVPNYPTRITSISTRIKVRNIIPCLLHPIAIVVVDYWNSLSRPSFFKKEIETLGLGLCLCNKMIHTTLLS